MKIDIYKDMRVYIAGPIKGVEDYVDRFDSARLYVSIMFPGARIVNPVDIVPPVDNPGPADYMRADIPALLTCNAIFMMPGWEKSVGAFCEWTIARTLGFDILYDTRFQKGGWDE